MFYVFLYENDYKGDSFYYDWLYEWHLYLLNNLMSGIPSLIELFLFFEIYLRFHEIPQNDLDLSLLAKFTSKSINKPFAAEAFARGRRKSAFWSEDGGIPLFTLDLRFLAEIDF